MKVPLDDEFVCLAVQIAAKLDRVGEAAFVWSDNEYQLQRYCGGWEPASRKFWFSFYAPDGGDYIFCLSPDGMRDAAKGDMRETVGKFWKQAPPW